MYATLIVICRLPYDNKLYMKISQKFLIDAKKKSLLLNNEGYEDVNITVSIIA